MIEKGNSGWLGKMRPQIACFGIAVLAVILTKALLPGVPENQILPILLIMGFVFPMFGQILIYLDKFPDKQRPLIRTIVIVCPLALFIALLTTFLIRQPDRTSHPAKQLTAAEKQLISQNGELQAMRGPYHRIRSSSQEALEVNTAANKLILRTLAVGDSDLSLSFQILKYEDLAYTWGMAAESASTPAAKLESAQQILDACKKAEALVAEVKRPQPYDPAIQAAREWLIADYTELRIKRLKAVALCTAWQINGESANRLAVAEIVSSFPPYYIENEQHPEESDELHPCLGDSPEKSISSHEANATNRH